MDDVNVALGVVTGLVVAASEVAAAVAVSIGNVSKEAVVVKAGGQEVPSTVQSSRWVRLAIEKMRRNNSRTTKTLKPLIKNSLIGRRAGIVNAISHVRPRWSSKQFFTIACSCDANPDEVKTLHVIEACCLRPEVSPIQILTEEMSSKLRSQRFETRDQVQQRRHRRLTAQSGSIS